MLILFQTRLPELAAEKKSDEEELAQTVKTIETATKSLADLAQQKTDDKTTYDWLRSGH
jgi:hypothetical protein